jgi:DNA-binding MarR family transcriptional regulator
MSGDVRHQLSADVDAATIAQRRQIFVTCSQHVSAPNLPADAVEAIAQLHSFPIYCNARTRSGACHSRGLLNWLMLATTKQSQTQGGIFRHPGRPEPMAKTSRPSCKSSNRKTRVAELSLIKDLEFREFIAELFAAAAGMQALRRAIARSVGLGGTGFAILLAIWHLNRPGPIGIKGLAEHLHLAGPHITDEVTRLVRLRYLHKSADLKDTRAVNLILTRQGAALLASLAPVLDEINLHLFEGVTARDMRVLRILFRRLIDRSAGSIEQLRAR